MDLLKFLSFGSWNIVLKEDDIHSVIAIICILTVMYFIKCFVLVITDCGQIKGIIRRSIAVIARIFQVLLQLSVLFILVSIGDFAFLMGSLGIWLAYQAILGIYFVIDEYNGTYIYSINQQIVNYIDKRFEPYDISFKNVKKFKNINKTIYVYRKNTIVG